jgi:imidazolonepropionase-like amidohydrolase
MLYLFPMKIFKRLVLVLLFLVLLFVVVGVAIVGIDNFNTRYLNTTNFNGNNSWVIKNVHVIPMYRDTVLRNQTVVIESGRIKAISDAPATQGFPEIDAKGKYLLPGLIDMHVHVWDRYELGLYLANGVTAVRNLWGRPEHLKIIQQLSHHEIVGPFFFSSGPKLTGPEFIGDDNLQLRSVQEAIGAVDAAKANGFDLIKTYYGLPKDYFEAIVRRAREVGLGVAAHPTPAVTYADHLIPGVVSLEHAEDIVQQPLNYALDTVKLNTVVDQFAQAKSTSFSPTLTVFHNILNMLKNPNILQEGSMSFMNPMIRQEDSKAQFERWSNARQKDPTIQDGIRAQHQFHLLALKKLHKAGVNIVCGTDAGIGVTVPGFSIHDELELYRQAGLSNFEVLQTATVNPIRVHDFMSDLGTVEPDKFANLLLVDRNPLEDLETLKTPSSVFVAGKRFEAKTLGVFTEKAKNRSNLLRSYLRYAYYLITK